MFNSYQLIDLHAAKEHDLAKDRSAAFAELLLKQGIQQGMQKGRAEECTTLSRELAKLGVDRAIIEKALKKRWFPHHIYLFQKIRF